MKDFVYKPKHIYLYHILPAMAGMMGISLYILGDTMLVGRRLGGVGLSALNLSIPMINVLNGIGLLIGMGGASLMSIRIGRGEFDEGNRYFTQSLAMAMLIGITITVFSMLKIDAIVSLLGGSSDNLSLSKDYLSMLMRFSPFFLTFTALTVFVRNDGGSRLAMIAMLTASLFNVLMDYVFLFPLDMGMGGCALATGLSPILGIGILLLHFRDRESRLKFVRGKLRLLEIFTTGLPSFVLEISQGIVIFAFNIVFLRLVGDAAVSAYGIVANLSLLFTALLAGIAHGIQPLVSKSYGAAKRELKLHYGRVAMVGSALLGIFILILGQLIPGTLASLFVSGEPDLIEQSVTGIRIYFTAFPLIGLNLVLTIFLQSQERARSAFKLSILRGLLLVLFGLWALPHFFGIKGVWMVIPAAELASFIIAIAALLPRYQRGIIWDR